MTRTKAGIGVLAVVAGVGAALFVDVYATPTTTVSTAGEPFGFAVTQLAVVGAAIALLAVSAVYRAQTD